MNDKEIVKETEEPFEKRHPILNTIIGIIILLILIVASVFFVKFLILFIGKGIDSIFAFLSKVATNVEAVIIVAFITGAVSIIGVVFTSVISKIIDYKQKRRDYLYQKRESPYSDFVEMVYKLQESTKRGGGYGQSEMLTDMLKFSRKLTLWGSNRVIKKYLKLRDQSINQPKPPQEILFVMEDIIYAMRKDLGLKRMKKGNLLAIFINDIESYLNKKLGL
jgi:hypothetical protein